MKVNGIPTRTIRALDNGSAIEIIDQTLLPYRFEKRILSDWRDGVEAIETMRVRGAPLIGIAGAWSVVLAVKENPENGPLLAAAERIQCARPTAVNLVWAVQKMLTALLPREPSQRFDTAVKLAAQLTQEDVDTCRAIGDMGCSLIAERYQALRRPVNILTHCNAGWLATVDYGTALAPIYAAFERGTPLHVWVDETRPRNQGLLTAWELRQQGVPHTIIADNAGGQLMQKGDGDFVIVGADNAIPFFVAAPSSTIDWKLNDGKREIPIENRSAAEVLTVRGVDQTGHDASVQLAPPDEAAVNPAFDVTHNRFVSGIITERGIFAPTDLATRFQDQIANAGL